MRMAIGVGSNRGDRAATIARAGELLAREPGIALVARSRLWENPAVGGPPGQAAFLNGAWVVETALGPHQVLMRLRRIEDALGRVRSVRDGPRTIDLDLLLTDPACIVASAVLTLPHPGLPLRDFVLIPLSEVAGSWRHPQLGTTVEDLRWALPATR